MGVDAGTLSADNFVVNQEPVLTNTGTMMVNDDAILPLGGTSDNSGTIAVASTRSETDLEILARSVTLQGGGQLTLADSTRLMKRKLAR